MNITKEIKQLPTTIENLSLVLYVNHDNTKEIVATITVSEPVEDAKDSIIAMLRHEIQSNGYIINDADELISVIEIYGVITVCINTKVEEKKEEQDIVSLNHNKCEVIIMKHVAQLLLADENALKNLSKQDIQMLQTYIAIGKFSDDDRNVVQNQTVAALNARPTRFYSWR